MDSESSGFATSAPISVVIRFNQFLNEHDVDGMLQSMTPDCVFENTFPPPDRTRFEGQAAVHSFWEEFFLGSSQAYIEIEEIFGMGQHCVMRWRYHWANPNGQTGHIRGVDIYLVRDGLIAEKLSYVKG